MWVESGETLTLYKYNRTPPTKEQWTSRPASRPAEMSDDENVPLLPSLEEEFDEDSDVASSKVAIARNDSRSSLFHCTSTVKMVVFVAVGVTLLVILVGVVLGIALPLVQKARKSSSSDKSVSSAVPIPSSNSSATMQSSLYSLSTPGQTFHTITATSIINPTSSHIASSTSSTSSQSSTSSRVSSSQATSPLPTSTILSTLLPSRVSSSQATSPLPTSTISSTPVPSSRDTPSSRMPFM